MQGEIYTVTYELCHVAHGGVYISRCDEHTGGIGGIGKGGGVHHGRHTHGHDGQAQALAVDGGAVIADAGAGDDTGVRELDSAAEAAERG